MKVHIIKSRRTRFVCFTPQGERWSVSRPALRRRPRLLASAPFPGLGPPLLNCTHTTFRSISPPNNNTTTQRHKADVLAMSAAPDGSAVFAAGVDSQVAMFAPVASSSASSSSSWTYLDCKRPHTHDVRAMEVVVLPGGRSVLVSGGLDAQLVAYPVGSFLKEHPVRLSRAPQSPICQLVPGMPVAEGSQQRQQQRLLCASNGSCDVWQLGSCDARQLRSGGSAGSSIASRSRWHTPHPGEGCPLDLVGSPRHLAQITLGGGARIACSAISPDAAFVACCSGQGPVRLYRLLPGASSLSGRQPPGEALRIERVKVPSGTERATAVAMTLRHHVAAHPDATI